MWNEITVNQAQKLDLIRKEIKEGETVIEVESKMLAVILETTIDKIDSLSLEDFTRLKKKLTFLDTEIGGNPSKFIQLGKKRYRCIYDIRQMPFARYVEGKAFSVDFVQNIHKIAATMVMPQKRGFFGWVDVKYNAIDHDKYASDMLKAPYEIVYNSCLFFCKVFINWMGSSKDYLINHLQSRGMTKAEAEKEVNHLWLTLDGILQPNK